MFGFVSKLVCEFSETLAKDGLDGNGLQFLKLINNSKAKDKGNHAP